MARRLASPTNFAGKQFEPGAIAGRLRQLRALASRIRGQREMGWVTDCGAYANFLDEFNRILFEQGSGDLNFGMSIINTAEAVSWNGRRFRYFDAVDRGRGAIVFEPVNDDSGDAEDAPGVDGAEGPPAFYDRSDVFTRRMQVSASRPWHISVRSNAEIAAIMPGMLSRAMREYVSTNGRDIPDVPGRGGVKQVKKGAASSKPSKGKIKAGSSAVRRPSVQPDIPLFKDVPILIGASATNARVLTAQIAQANLRAQAARKKGRKNAEVARIAEQFEREVIRDRRLRIADIEAGSANIERIFAAALAQNRTLTKAVRSLSKPNPNQTTAKRLANLDAHSKLISLTNEAGVASIFVGIVEAQVEVYKKNTPVRDVRKHVSAFSAPLPPEQPGEGILQNSYQLIATRDLARLISQ